MTTDAIREELAEIGREAAIAGKALFEKLETSFESRMSFEERKSVWNEFHRMLERIDNVICLASMCESDSKPEQLEGNLKAAKVSAAGIGGKQHEPRLSRH